MKKNREKEISQFLGHCKRALIDYMPLLMHFAFASGFSGSARKSNCRSFMV